MKINKTLANPHGLSTKQTLVIEDMIKNVEEGYGLTATQSHQRFYQTKNPAIIANENLNRPNFREALITGLTKRRILGKNSIMEKKLTEGLDATTVTENGETIDYRNRLSYIQEIAKIVGLYAPEKIDKRTLNLNIDVEPAELDKRIEQLQNELSI